MGEPGVAKSFWVSYHCFCFRRSSPFFLFLSSSLTPSGPSAISFPGVTIADQTLASPPPSCLSNETDMDTANIPDVSAHEDPPKSFQRDDSPPLPPAHTQQPPAKNPKKKI
ncbi:hypothetical protein NPIL_559821 [Nephila pilipes]|uniref:Uncharacterized protein n=1 Tax=Nephila pilipes TaxID=299642 RepID=A0A8X6JRX6_NEPPI|nr:hypothetical protein NPIL_559821 [Nephila pilipes]